MQIVDPKNFTIPTDYTVFYCGASWCGPCKTAEPEALKIAAEYPNTPLYKFSFDNKEEAALLPREILDKIQGIPTILVIENKKIIHKFGYNSKRFKEVMSREEIIYSFKETLFTKLSTQPFTHNVISANEKVVKVNLTDPELQELGLFGSVNANNLYYLPKASEIFEIEEDNIEILE